MHPNQSICILALVASSCTNPYALSVTDLNYDAVERPGVIQLSDAKLYNRESLINERRDEVEYLTGLLDSSRTITLSPAIIRELEQVSSLAASVGLSFDPAGALNYRRDVETTSIQQEIDVLKLQLQLDQLNKDAELFRKGIDAQTAPSSPLPSATGESTDVTSGVSGAPDTAAIDKVIESLKSFATRLETNRTPLIAVTPASNVDPIDDFFDRSAYRDLLKSAISAENLDSLHDAEGAALMRFQFSATLFPPPHGYLNTLGVVRTTASLSPIHEEQERALYLLWIDYVNRNLNRVDTDTLESPKLLKLNAPLYYLGVSSGLFEVTQLEIPRDQNAATQCGGFIRFESKDEKCLYLKIALPNRNGQLGATGPEARDVLFNDEEDAIEHMKLARAKLRAMRNDKNLDKSTLLTKPECQIAPNSPLGLGTLDVENGNTYYRTIGATLVAADIVARDGALVENALRIALDRGLDDALGGYPNNWLATKFEAWRVLAAESTLLLEETVAGTDCTLTTRSRPIAAPPLVFHEVIKDAESRPIRIYDVGPRGRAQRISTAARAADAISLAAAIKGSAPSAGVSGKADAAFSRYAVGKADALERAPIIVSFAEPSASIVTQRKEVQIDKSRASSFGWILGPKASMIPDKKRLEFRHQVTPFELTVDLSLPGWWPLIEFETKTAWAPNWSTGQGSVIAVPDALPSTVMTVRLSPNSADLANLTDLLIRKVSAQASSAYPSIASIEPKVLSACSSATTVTVSGGNIWRATQVIVGGTELNGTAVRVTPDMSGVLVDVDARALPQARINGKDGPIKIFVMNQDGRADGSVLLTHVNPEGGCSQSKPPKPATAPIISGIIPAEFSTCHPSPTFTLSGSNLADANAVFVGGENAATTVSTDGKTLKVTISGADLRKKYAGLATVVIVVKTKSGESAQTDVKVVHPQQCP